MLKDAECNVELMTHRAMRVELQSIHCSSSTELSCKPVAVPRHLQMQIGLSAHQNVHMNQDPSTEPLCMPACGPLTSAHKMVCALHQQYATILLSYATTADLALHDAAATAATLPQASFQAKCYVS